jgi:hypothetical protein
MAHWKELLEDEKNETVFRALSNQSEFEERIEGTNFQGFVDQFRVIIGGIEAQSDLILQQKKVAIKKLRASESLIAIELRHIHERFSAIEDPDTAYLTEKFWELYRVCENAVFEKLQSEVDPSIMELPICQLTHYMELIGETGWEDGSAVVVAMRNLVRRQLRFILNKHSTWSYEKWHQAMNKEFWTKKKKPPHPWECLSPADWSTIMSSVLLSSCDNYFYEYLGKEKIALERFIFLSNDKLASPGSETLAKPPSRRSKWNQKFTPTDNCPSLEHALDGVYDNGKFIPKYRKTFECVVRLNPPERLSDPSHWGYTAWKYCSFARSQAR